MRETLPDNEPSLQEGEFAFTEWLLFRGHRLLIAGLVLGLIWALSIFLIQFNVLEVGPSSSMPTLLGGIIAGQLTLFTVTLSINQLILSRMFASPTEINRRLRGTIDFRQQVRDVTDDPRPPVNPREFLAVIARALHARAEEHRRKCRHGRSKTPRGDRRVRGIASELLEGYRGPRKGRADGNPLHRIRAFTRNVRAKYSSCGTASDRAERSSRTYFGDTGGRFDDTRGSARRPAVFQDPDYPAATRQPLAVHRLHWHPVDSHSDTAAPFLHFGWGSQSSGTVHSAGSGVDHPDNHDPERSSRRVRPPPGCRGRAYGRNRPVPSGGVGSPFRCRPTTSSSTSRPIQRGYLTTGLTSAGR